MSHIPKNTNFKERILQELTRQNFMHHMNFNLNKILPGRMEGELVVEPIHFQHSGFVHGGVIATIADIVAGFSAVSLVREDQKVVTGELKVSYFAKGEGEKLKAVGYVVKPGSKIHFCEAEVYSVSNGVEKLIARATTTMVTI